MRAALAFTGLALLAAGCASTETEPTTVTPVPAAPEPTAGLDWLLIQDHGQSGLWYGTDESENIILAFTCVDGGGRIQLFRTASDETMAEFILESGAETARFAATGSELATRSAGQFLSAETDADEPVFNAFRSTGWLAMWSGAERQTYAAHPGSQAGIERFFAACGAGA